LVSAIAAGGAARSQGGGTRPARAPRLAIERFPIAPPLLPRFQFPTKGEEPRLEFDATTRDLGDIPDGPEQMATFDFTNRGAGPLLLLGMRLQCGCTLGKLEVAGKTYELGDPIPPGARGRLVLTLRTKGLIGEKDLKADLLCNDPAWPETAEAEFGHVTLTLKCKILRVYEWEGTGGAVDLGRFIAGHPQEKTVVLKNTRGDAFEIASIEGGRGALEVKFEPEDAKKTRWRVVLAAIPKIPLGIFTRQLLVKTRGAAALAAAGADLYVVGTARGTVDVHPPAGLPLQVILRGTPKSATLSLINESGREWKVGNWRLLDPASVTGKPESEWKPARAEILEHLKLEPKETAPNRQADVVVTVDASMPPGPFAAILAGSTGLEDGPATITALVSGTIR
jgi:hypothetical protein